MGAGASVGREPGIRVAGFALSLVGWVVLAVSLFLPRNDSAMQGITTSLGSATGRLIEYWPIGILLVFLLALILPAILFARRLPGNFMWLLAGMWLVASALTIYAGLNLDEVTFATRSVGAPAYAGVSSGDPAIGTTLSIIGANLGFVGAGLMAWPRRPA